eukprot:809936-Rhodomonas_salina.4
MSGNGIGYGATSRRDVRIGEVQLGLYNPTQVSPRFWRRNQTPFPAFHVQIVPGMQSLGFDPAQMGLRFCCEIKLFEPSHPYNFVPGTRVLIPPPFITAMLSCGAQFSRGRTEIGAALKKIRGEAKTVSYTHLRAHETEADL